MKESKLCNGWLCWRWLQRNLVSVWKFALFVGYWHDCLSIFFADWCHLPSRWTIRDICYHYLAFIVLCVWKYLLLLLVFDELLHLVLACCQSLVDVFLLGFQYWSDYTLLICCFVPWLIIFLCWWRMFHDDFCFRENFKFYIVCHIQVCLTS